jgi:hypothetical protein
MQSASILQNSFNLPVPVGISISRPGLLYSQDFHRRELWRRNAVTRPEA